MKMRWQWGFGAVYFLVLSLLFLHQINSGDFFHHLNSGKYVIEHLRLPYLDDLTFTAYGKPWVAYGWGSGVVYYLIYTVFGVSGIDVLFAFFGVLASLFLFLTLRKLKIPFLNTAVLVWLAAAIVSLRWPTRPEVLGAVFVSALIYFLVAGRKRMIFLPLFFWLWAIIYGASAFLGIIIFGFWIVVTRTFNKKIFSVFALSVVFSLLNGYGFSSFLYIFQIPQIAPHVGEWLPLYKTLDKTIPDLVLFYQYTVLVYLLFVVLYLLMVVFLLLKNREIIYKNIFLFGLSLAVFAPFYTNRFINLAPFVVVPALGIIYWEIQRKGKRVMMVAVILIAVLATWTRFTHFDFGLGISPAPFQVKVTEFLKNNKIDGNIYAPQEIGSFLSWELPKSKVFVDTRDDLFTNTKVFEDLGNLDSGKIDIISILHKYGADIVVGDIGGGHTYKPLFYNDDWKIIFLTDGYFVAVRKSLIGDREIKTYEAIDPFRSPPVKGGKLEEAARELAGLIALDSDSLENKFRLIDVKLTQDQPVEAKRVLETIKTGDNFGGSNINFGLGYLELAGRVYLAGGECVRAFAALDKADKLSRGKLIFFPATRLPTSVNKYWGEYYLKCAGDRVRALEYFNLYLAGNKNPLEQRQIEQLLGKTYGN